MPADITFRTRNHKPEPETTNHYPGFIEAWAIVKLAAARANTDVGAMKKEKLAVIEKACQAVLDGKYHDQPKVDWYLGGRVPLQTTSSTLG